MLIIKNFILMMKNEQFIAKIDQNRGKSFLKLY